MADEFIEERVPSPPEPDPKRVRSRAQEIENEAGDDPPDDPEAAAHGLLRESDARTVDPASRTLDEDRVERRTSEDATPPPE